MHSVCKELRARWSVWCAIDCNFIRGAGVLREKEGEEMLPARGRGALKNSCEGVYAWLHTVNMRVMTVRVVMGPLRPETRRSRAFW